MRVALACPYAWDAPGGVQVHVRQLAAALRERGHQTLILAPARGRAAEAGVEVVGRAVGVPFNGSIAPICPDPRSRRVIRRALGRFRPDVVHVHEPSAPSTGMFAALVATCPVVATFHAYSEGSRALTVIGPVLRRMWSRLAIRLAVSEAAAEFARRQVRGEVRVIPNGADVELFSAASPSDLPPGRRLLFVNRLEPRKGFGVAIRAFNLVAQEMPEALLVVAGDGPERAVVDELPPQARSRVHMLGSVPHRDLPPFHAACEVFLGPAVGGESFGIVLVEAMAAGLPVVASDIPGYREVVRDGVDGILVPPRHPGELAAAALRVLRDPALAERLRKAGKERANDYRWESVAARIEDAYLEADRASR